MSDYCVMPPYVKKDIKPNILIIMDNNTVSNPVGKGMQDPAYCTVDATSTGSLILCTDQYDPSKAYSGYFKSSLNYSVSSGEWTPDNTATGIFSGNILNWAATSKFDLLESILVGGVSTSRTSNPNDLWMMANSWQKILKYNNNDGLGVRTCIFTMDTVKGLSVGETTNGACGYLDSPAHPFNSTNGQIVASLGTGTENGSAADRSSRQGLRAYAGMFHGAAQKVLGLISSVMDLFSTDAEAAKPLAIQGGSTSLASASQCISGYSSGTITASGGSGTGYVWSISGQTSGTNGCAAGTYPLSSSDTGLCMSNTSDTPAGAIITGRPKVYGTITFTLHVHDDQGEVNNHYDSKQYSITISRATVTITATTLPSAVEGAYYQQQVYATGDCIDPGSGPTTWQVSAGLPSGTGISPNNSSWAEPYVYVFGTPSAAGTYTFTLTANDSGGNTASRQFSLVVGAGGNLVMSPGSPLPSGTAGKYYSQLISAASKNCNSCSGWVWSSSGSLPPGLTLLTNSTAGYCYSNNNTYVWLAGTPSAPGTYSFTLRAQDCSGSNSVTQTYSITIIGTGQPPRASYGPGKKVCMGNYTVNCGNAGTCISHASDAGGSPCANAAYCSGSDKCILRSGLVDKFWGQARFGLLDFVKQAGNANTKIEYCTGTDPTTTYPDSNFLTTIENAVPIDPTTTLVNAEYSGIYDYYAYTNTPGTCDPIDSKHCRQNFVLAITAGVGADNPPTPGGGTASILPDPPMPAACSTSSNKNLAKNSCFGDRVDVRNSPTFGKDATSGSQNVYTYIVNTMGVPKTDGYNPNNTPATTGDMLDQAAIKGGGNYYEVTDPTKLKAELEQAFQDIIKRAAAGTAASVLASGEGSGANLVQAVFYPRREFYNMSTGSYDEVAWVGRLTNFWYYVDPFFSNSTIREDEGDKILNLLTPSRPASATSNVTPSDYIVQMYFDTTSQATMAHRWADTNGDGVPDGAQFPADVKFEGLGNLWEAGYSLWNRNVSSNPRTIYTDCNLQNGTCIGSTGLMNFSTANATVLQQYLQAGSSDEASKKISWILGFDKFCTGTSNPCRQNVDCTSGTCSDTPYRSRTVTLNLCSSSNILCESDSDCPDHSTGSCASAGSNTWKLGDVLNSTPKISSMIPLNGYDVAYKDLSYAAFLQTSGYQGRGMVFAGANDGMLHAFYLGQFKRPSPLSDWTPTSQTQIAKLDGTGLGEERWAFIPKNALPYLTYQTDINYGGCHVYTIDLTPYVFDASIGGCTEETNYWNCDKYDTTVTPAVPITARWKTILIGGMRVGGGCQQTCAAGADCVATPASDPVSGRGLGYSSYFALDVTDQNNPQLLWQFSGADLTGADADSLGFATTGPAVVRVNARPQSGGYQVNKDKNGRWFVVFGSGPTGPINTTSMQFMGRSNQPLKLFIFDLKNGPAGGIWKVGDSLNIQNAFVGSLVNSSQDTDLDYQDDVLYAPYVRKCGTMSTNISCSDTNWTNGGVLRLRIKDKNVATISSAADTALNPDNWGLSIAAEDVGPVTSSVVRLQNTSNLWLYFGSGRYFYEQGTTVDDATTQRTIYGVKDPCFTASGWTAGCTTTASSFTDVTSNANAVPTDITSDGWKILLDPAVNPNTDPGCSTGQYGYYEGNPSTFVCRDYYAEREITDPLSTTSGLVFFTTFKPYQDECSLGGKSFIWAVKYNTGGAPGAMLKGKALIQVSTGSIEQLDMSTAFNQAGGRKSSSLEGVPPTMQGLSIISPPPPTKKVIHMRER